MARRHFEGSALKFEAALAKLAGEDGYAGLAWLRQPPAACTWLLQLGQAGVLKDTKADAQADDTYNLIMKDKDRLLSINEPLRFIFRACYELWAIILLE